MKVKWSEGSNNKIALFNYLFSNLFMKRSDVIDSRGVHTDNPKPISYSDEKGSEVSAIVGINITKQLILRAQR